MATGSNRPIARATDATSRRTPASMAPQMSARAGQAIHVRVCRT
jgi:hypothetical protein